MILKMVMITLIIGVAVNSASAAAFSKVYVQSGSEVLPIEYVQYGVPSVSLAGPQMGQLSTGSVGKVVSEAGIVAPCTMPCLYPGQVVSAVPPISPASPNILTYKSSVPVVMSTKEETPGYEYSYVVYDKNTGDHKSQYELSDGSIVQGEYSLLQPDGFVREVTYIADNTRGFNAVVKHFLPEKEQKKKETSEKPNQKPPCPEVKNDTVPEITENKQESPSEETNQKLAKLELGDEKSIFIKKNDQNQPSEKNIKKKSNAEINESKKKELVKKNSVIENIQNELKADAPKYLISNPLVEDIPKQKMEQTSIETQKSIKPAEVHESEVSTEGNKKISTGEINKGESKHSAEVGVFKTETTSQPSLEVTDVLVPYTDIIKCVEAAVNSASKVPGVPKLDSPLTYIVLNKPC